MAFRKVRKGLSFFDSNMVRNGDHSIVRNRNKAYYAGDDPDTIFGGICMRKITVNDVKKGNKERIVEFFKELFDQWQKDDSELDKMLTRIASRPNRIIKTEDDETVKEIYGTLFVGFMKEISTPKAYELIVKWMFEEEKK